MVTSAEERAVILWQPLSIFERLDDAAILAELRGQALKAYVYRFKAEGRTITGLSKRGVDAAVSEMARKGEVIRELDITLHWEEEAVAVIVKAGRFVVSSDGKEILLETSYGSKRQPRKMGVNARDRFGRVLRDKPQVLVDDPFFFEKAVAKAARNAKRRLIPEDLVTGLINQSLTTAGRLRDVKPGEEEEDSPPEETGAMGSETPEAIRDGQKPEASQKESPPPEPQDLTAEQLSQEARTLGYTSKEKVFEALGVASLKEWRGKATTATPLKEALETLKLKAQAEETSENLPL